MPREQTILANPEPAPLSTSETMERLHARLDELRHEEHELAHRHAAAALSSAKGDASAATELNECVQTMRSNELEQKAVSAALQAGRSALLKERYAEEKEERTASLRALPPAISRLISARMRFQEIAVQAQEAWKELGAAKREMSDALDRCGPAYQMRLHNNTSWMFRAPAEAPKIEDELKRFAAMDSAEVADIAERTKQANLDEGERRVQRALSELSKELRDEARDQAA